VSGTSAINSYNLKTGFNIGQIYVRVSAYDAAGNESAQTSPLIFSTTGGSCLNVPVGLLKCYDEFYDWNGSSFTRHIVANTESEIIDDCEYYGIPDNHPCTYSSSGY